MSKAKGAKGSSEEKENLVKYRSCSYVIHLTGVAGGVLFHSPAEWRFDDRCMIISKWLR